MQSTQDLSRGVASSSPRTSRGLCPMRKEGTFPGRSRKERPGCERPDPQAPPHSSPSPSRTKPQTPLRLNIICFANGDRAPFVIGSRSTPVSTSRAFWTPSRVSTYKMALRPSAEEAFLFRISKLSVTDRQSSRKRSAAATVAPLARPTRPISQ